MSKINKSEEKISEVLLPNELRHRQWADFIETLLNNGWLELDDIFPVIKKGTANMTGKNEKKLFKQPKSKII